jgi:hypothetical protein
MKGSKGKRQLLELGNATLMQTVSLDSKGALSMDIMNSSYTVNGIKGF